MSKESTIDAVIAKAPVNKTAAVVTGKGPTYEPAKRIQTSDSPFPLPINRDKPCPLVGIRRGRLTVAGYSAEKNGRLVVRCDCGTWTLRTARSMKNERNDGDRCEHCRHLAYLKRNDEYRRTGKNGDTSWRNA